MFTSTTFGMGLRRLARRVPVVGAVREYLRRWDPADPEEIEQQFHGSGYLIFDPEVPGDVLDRAVADTLARPEAMANLHHGSRWFDGWKESRAVRSIALAPRVLRVLRQL